MGSIQNAPGGQAPRVNDLVARNNRTQGMLGQALAAPQGQAGAPTITDLIRSVGQNLQARDQALAAPAAAPLTPVSAPPVAPAPFNAAQNQQVANTIGQAQAAPAGGGGPNVADIIRQIRMLQAQGG